MRRYISELKAPIVRREMRGAAVITYVVIVAIIWVIAFVAAIAVWEAAAHENYLWADSNFYSEGSKQCGSGFVLSKQVDGSYQPYMLASHDDGNVYFHSTHFTRLLVVSL
jgi:hypothetical protein